jgi:lipopolysaccharide biosynthesis glycosyltransferase
MSKPTGAQTNTHHFFTIVTQNYLAYAFVLGESVLRYHADSIFSIFLVDDLDRRWKSAIESREFRAIYPEEIPLADYRKFVFQYNVTEASTGIKPSVIQMLFDRGAETVIYLDPDILCFRRFDEVLAALDCNSIVLTPHICSPASDDYYPGERGLMNSGVFNLGFLALRKSETSLRFLSWWAEHLRRDCVQEPEAGLFVDQKWIDLVPTCFDHVYIIRSRAYNIAYWNLHERILEERSGVLYEARSGDRVAFIHFSGVTTGDLNCITKYAQRNPIGRLAYKKRHTLDGRPDLIRPFRLYERLLVSANIESFSKIPYAYTTYDNGEPISQLERSLYLGSDAWRESIADPFCTQQGSFWHACRKVGVRAVPVPVIRSSAQETVDKYGLYMRFIEFTIRCCLQVLGPHKYLQFAKYIRHQLLPLNHGFLLSDRVGARVPHDAIDPASSDREDYGKPACEAHKL